MDDVVRHFTEDRLTIGVVGLGYVGLPLTVLAAERGLDVIGFDVSDERVAALNGGTSHVEDVSDAELAEALGSGAVFTTDEEALRAADAVLIAVPSPLNRSRQPDMSYIEAASNMVERIAHPGMLVSLESTTYPGTTEDYLVPAVERAGLTIDEDVFVAFSPERVDPGNALSTGQIPKVSAACRSAPARLPLRRTAVSWIRCTRCRRRGRPS